MTFSSLRADGVIRLVSAQSHSLFFFILPTVKLDRSRLWMLIPDGKARMKAAQMQFAPSHVNAKRRRQKA